MCAYKWPETFNIVAGAGVGAAVARTWGTLLAEATGMKLRVAVDDDVVSRLRWVADGRFYLTAGGTNKTRQTLVAEPKFALRDGGPFPVRIAWSQSHDNAGFFVRADSNIQSVYDVKPGTRISGLTASATSPIVDGFLAWAQVDAKDIIWITPKDIPDKARAVMDGRADLSFGIPTSQVVEEIEQQAPGIRWIELNAEKDPAGARRFKELDPIIGFAPILNGVPSSLGRWGTCGTSLYTTSATTDAALIYNLAKWLDENWASYKDLHSWNRFMTRELLVREIAQTFIPVHEGLISYLDELGLWTAAHQKRQDANVALVDRYCQAYRGALLRADEQGVPVGPTSDAWLEIWADCQRKAELPEFKMFLGLDNA